MTCIFSPCRKYRYTLERKWSDGDTCMFIGLNPSTADEIQDDPTVRRCIRYAKSWGYGKLIMTNIFAFRATDPQDMFAAQEPIGEENDFYLLKSFQESKIAIAAWGTHGIYLNRGQFVRGLLAPLHYLKLTKKGFPNHPLYLKKNLQPIMWS